MKSVLQLGRRFDVTRLIDDLTTAEQFGVRHTHYNTRDHDGGWSAISLVSLDGRTDAEAIQGLTGEYRKTPVLHACHYFDEIVDSFPCRKERVRLMRLAPGSHIFAHTDGVRFAWALRQIVRLHIPIVTGDRVNFLVEGKRVQMQPGELWYCDVSRLHEVSNTGSIARVHLVIDLLIDDWVTGFFPRESPWERAGNVTFRAREWVSAKRQGAHRRLRAWALR